MFTSDKIVEPAMALRFIYSLYYAINKKKEFDIMKRMTLKEMERRHNIIKEFSLKYRKEIIDIGASWCGTPTIPAYGKINYKKYMNKLTNDEFVGQMLANINCDYSINMYEKVLNNKMSIQEFVKIHSNDNYFVD